MEEPNIKFDSLVVANADDGVLPGHDHRSVDGVRVPVQLAQQMRMLASRHRRHGFKVGRYSYVAARYR